MDTRSDHMLARSSIGVNPRNREADPGDEVAVRLLKAHFLNRTDRLAYLSPRGSPCPVEGSTNLDAMLRAHVLGEAAPEVTVRWVTAAGSSGTSTGRFRLGTYSPAPDGTTLFGCVDCDGGGRHGNPLADPLGVALELLNRLDNLGLSAYVERSGGGGGWHVWVFFSASVPAALVRRLLFALVPRDAELKDGSLANPEANEGIEVFPKQDKIEPDGLGNMVWLPWWSG